MTKRSNLSPRAIFFGLVIVAFVGTCSCRQMSRSSKLLPTSPSLPSTPRIATPALPVHEAVVKTARPQNIRVALIKDAPMIRISGGKNKKLLNISGQILQQLPDEAVLEARFNAGTLILNGVSLSGEPAAIIESAADAPLRVNDQEASACVRVVHLPRATGLAAILQLNVEDYLPGVLAGEVPFERWHPEALKAQAIASRSYSLYQAKKNVAEAYDVESTVMSQVFRPGYRANPILRGAVDSTRGLVLTVASVPFPAYFHSTCGGRTSNSAIIFPDQPTFKPLCGVICSYCSASPHYRWKCALRKDALAEKLRVYSSATASVVKLIGLEFFDATNQSVGLTPGRLERATQARVRHSQGLLNIGGNQFRLLVGARELKSLLLEQVADGGDIINISGGGFGHGVGMCQYGSQGMAQAGGLHTQILGLYYPGAELTKLY
ncbi:MAG: SpoIID/LytB domain-containing protein [Planctomycetota bacterium]